MLRVILFKEEEGAWALGPPIYCNPDGMKDIFFCGLFLKLLLRFVNISCKTVVQPVVCRLSSTLPPFTPTHPPGSSSGRKSNVKTHSVHHAGQFKTWTFYSINKIPPGCPGKLPKSGHVKRRWSDLWKSCNDWWKLQICTKIVDKWICFNSCHTIPSFPLPFFFLPERQSCVQFEQSNF